MNIFSPFDTTDIREDIRADHSEHLVEGAVRERWDMIEDSEGEEHFNWFWLAWEDLFGLDEVESPDTAFSSVL